MIGTVPVVLFSSSNILYNKSISEVVMLILIVSQKSSRSWPLVRCVFSTISQPWRFERWCYDIWCNDIWNAININNFIINFIIIGCLTGSITIGGLLFVFLVCPSSFPSPLRQSKMKIKMKIKMKNTKMISYDTHFWDDDSSIQMRIAKRSQSIEMHLWEDLGLLISSTNCWFVR